MTNYQDITGERVVIVFDGKGDVSESMNDENGIQVFYSKSGITADQIIERLAGKYSKTRNITVASRDRAVLDTCSSFGADAISPKTLEDLSQEYKVSRERIRQIETRAFEKLQIAVKTKAKELKLIDHDET